MRSADSCNLTSQLYCANSGSSALFETRVVAGTAADRQFLPARTSHELLTRRRGHGAHGGGAGDRGLGDGAEGSDETGHGGEWRRDVVEGREKVGLDVGYIDRWGERRGGRGCERQPARQTEVGRMYGRAWAGTSLYLPPPTCPDRLARLSGVPRGIQGTEATTLTHALSLLSLLRTSPSNLDLWIIPIILIGPAFASRHAGASGAPDMAVDVRAWRRDQSKWTSTSKSEANLARDASVTRVPPSPPTARRPGLYIHDSTAA